MLVLTHDILRDDDSLVQSLANSPFCNARRVALHSFDTEAEFTDMIAKFRKSSGSTLIVDCNVVSEADVKQIDHVKYLLESVTAGVGLALVRAPSLVHVSSARTAGSGAAAAIAASAATEAEQRLEDEKVESMPAPSVPVSDAVSSVKHVVLIIHSKRGTAANALQFPLLFDRVWRVAFIDALLPDSTLGEPLCVSFQFGLFVTFLYLSLGVPSLIQMRHRPVCQLVCESFQYLMRRVFRWSLAQLSFSSAIPVEQHVLLLKNLVNGAWDQDAFMKVVEQHTRHMIVDEGLLLSFSLWLSVFNPFICHVFLCSTAFCFCPSNFPPFPLSR